MAGEWIPWTKGLTRKPEVTIIARKSGRTPREVSALLMEFWEWADDHTTDGQLTGLRPEDLGAILPQVDSYFFDLLIDVGWLARTESGLRIPKFTRWMGNSAKRRLKEAKRKRRLRVYEIAAHESGQNAPNNTGQNKTGHTKQSSLPPRSSGGVVGGERPSPERDWSKGEFADSVTQHLGPDVAAAMPWYASAAELLARTLGYRRTDDPVLFADWSIPLLKLGCTHDEFGSAVDHFREKPHEARPKSRRDCYSQLARSIRASRAQHASGGDPEFRRQYVADQERRRQERQQPKGELCPPPL